jgi:hypothetical protein
MVIAYGSRLLSKSENNNAQIEKEMLSIVFGVQLFRCYLYGIHFIVVTDHLPSTALRFNKTPKSSRLLIQWGLILSDFDFVYCAGKKRVHTLPFALSMAFSFMLNLVFLAS